ncbi:hypothetical protein [Amycolatopsis viridis]|uniref:Secreted protein n=1 Tax=Amycolatopsis viridis TaxID=185678 RepID=A0ABX0SRC3_9PSEU|nr:hypothetical protein [Amycolatopsis viridis]NIH79170.1 hypothetical protein [Amycolatopsis viridis]
MRKTMGALLGVVMAGAFSVAAAPSASAVTWDHTMKTDDDRPGGIVKWHMIGDVVEVCDIQADGWDAVAHVDDAAGHSYTIQAVGNGSCTRVDAKKKGKYDLAEVRYIGFKVCLKKGKVEDFCDNAAWFNYEP